MGFAKIMAIISVRKQVLLQFYYVHHCIEFIAFGKCISLLLWFPCPPKMANTAEGLWCSTPTSKHWLSATCLARLPIWAKQKPCERYRIFHLSSQLEAKPPGRCCLSKW